jgi:alpha-L-rhamnosidase
LTFARTSYRSIRGRIVSNWRIEGGVLHADVTVPPGSGATLYLPSAAADAVTESGSPAARAVGVKYSGTDRGKAIFELASGSYQFASRMP